MWCLPKVNNHTIEQQNLHKVLDSQNSRDKYILTKLIIPDKKRGANYIAVKNHENDRHNKCINCKKQKARNRVPVEQRACIFHSQVI